MRIEALTFLRFFAALVVVVYHYGRGTGLSQLARPLMISGSQMVTFFFVLSGFVLLVSQPEGRRQGLGAFYRARIARIVPIYWVALFWAMLALWKWPGPVDFFLHASFLQAWVPGHVYQLNFPAWSVSVEAFFYASFPLFLFWLRRRRPAVGSYLALTLGLWLLTQVALAQSFEFPAQGSLPRRAFDAYHFLPINHLCSFLLGTAGGYAFQATQAKPRAKGIASVLWILLSFLLIYGALRFGPRLQENLGVHLAQRVSFLAPLFLACIWSLARADNPLTRGLSLSPLVLLGEASYSLYILQTPALISYRKWLAPHLGLGRDGSFYLYLSLLILLSILTMYLIERPARRALRRRWAQPN